MAAPLLDLGDIGLVVERIGGGCRTQRVDAEAIDLSIDAGRAAICADDVVIDGIRIERTVAYLRAVVDDGTEHWRGGIAATAGKRQVFFNQLLRRHLHGNEADLPALAMQAKMHHA